MAAPGEWVLPMNDVLTASEDVYLLTAVEAADDVICTAVMEANCRADAAVGASNTLWQYVLVLESQRDQYYHNWQEAVGQLHASIAKNRNIEPAVVENLLLQRKIAELEGRLAQYESKQGHPTQNEGSHRERQETSNKGSSHSQEDNTDETEFEEDDEIYGEERQLEIGYSEGEVTAESESEN